MPAPLKDINKHILRPRRDNDNISYGAVCCDWTTLLYHGEQFLGTRRVTFNVHNLLFTWNLSMEITIRRASKNCSP